MQFQHHPLLILNNFSGDQKHLEIMSKTFQNMFPSININKVQLRSIRRVLMLNYNEEDDTVDLRQYTITVWERYVLFCLLRPSRFPDKSYNCDYICHLSHVFKIYSFTCSIDQLAFLVASRSYFWWRTIRSRTLVDVRIFPTSLQSMIIELKYYSSQFLILNIVCIM